MELLLQAEEQAKKHKNRNKLPGLRGSAGPASPVALHHATVPGALPAWAMPAESTKRENRAGRRGNGPKDGVGARRGGFTPPSCGGGHVIGEARAFPVPGTQGGGSQARSVRPERRRMGVRWPYGAGWPCPRRSLRRSADKAQDVAVNPRGFREVARGRVESVPLSTTSVSTSCRSGLSQHTSTVSAGRDAAGRALAGGVAGAGAGGASPPMRLRRKASSWRRVRRVRPRESWSGSLSRRSARPESRSRSRARSANRFPKPVRHRGAPFGPTRRSCRRRKRSPGSPAGPGAGEAFVSSGQDGKARAGGRRRARAAGAGHQAAATPGFSGDASQKRAVQGQRSAGRGRMRSNTPPAALRARLTRMSGLHHSPASRSTLMRA